MLQILTGPAVLLQGSWESPQLLSSGSCFMNMVDSAKISILTIEYGFYIRLLKATWICIPTHLETCLSWIPCAKVIRVICMQRYSQTRHLGLFIFNPKIAKVTGPILDAHLTDKLHIYHQSWLPISYERRHSIVEIGKEFEGWISLNNWCAIKIWETDGHCGWMEDVVLPRSCNPKTRKPTIILE